jgi:hypothetical protein
MLSLVDWIYIRNLSTVNKPAALYLNPQAVSSQPVVRLPAGTQATVDIGNLLQLNLK